MFTCLDKSGKQIHTDDVVKLLEDTPAGVKAGTEALVLTILSPERVSINPVNGGLPEIVEPQDLEVTYSFISAVEKLSSNAELQDILRSAEERYKKKMEESKEEKKRSGRGKSERIVERQAELEVVEGI